MVLTETPASLVEATTHSTAIDAEANIILCTIVAAVATVFLVITAVFVYRRSEV